MVVQSGLDRLLQDSASIKKLSGARVGLLANPTSVTASYIHALDALLDAGVSIQRLFGPEHGIRGEAQDMESVGENLDPISGISCVSLYGSTLESLTPPHDSLADLDILICDIQDIGSRYYTYIYTIGLAMKAAGKAECEVWVLDRPNPIRGDVVRGNVLLDDYKSFVGLQSIAVRHGLTIGEAARFFNAYTDWKCELKIVELEGWKRSMWFDETGLPWVLPSPNMPTLETAIVYPGQCILEGTVISEGRGTTRPFEIIGAPFLDANQFQKEMSAFDLPGVAFRALSFRPTFQKCAGQTCAGIQIHVTDRNVFDSIAMAYAELSLLLKYPEFAWRKEAYEFVENRLAIDLLIGDPILRQALEDGNDPIELSQTVGKRRARFDAQRAEILIYS